MQRERTSKHEYNTNVLVETVVKHIRLQDDDT